MFEFKNVIWVAFLSVFTLTATAFIAMCIFVIGSHVGFANTSPSWGDIFTFGSIFVAAIIAYIGWKRAEKNQSDAWERAEKNQREIWKRDDEKRKEGSNRDAAIQAIILYRGLDSVINAAWQVMDLFWIEGEQLDDTKFRFEFQKVKFQTLVNKLQDKNDLNQATLLLRGDFEIGQQYLGIVETMANINETFIAFTEAINMEHNELLPPERKNRHTQGQLNYLRAHTTNLLWSIEILRRYLREYPITQSPEITTLDLKDSTVILANTATRTENSMSSDGKSKYEAYDHALKILSIGTTKEWARAAKYYDNSVRAAEE